MKIMGGGYLNADQMRALGIKSVGGHVMVHERAILVDLERIELGSHVRIDAYCVLSAAGGSIKIGNYVHIASHADLYGGAGIEMADFSGLSQGVRVYSISDDYSGACLTNPTVPKAYARPIRGAVKIGRHSIIGSGSVILPGVDIPEGVSVGALSLVRNSLEPWGVYAGAPVRRIKNRDRQLLQDEAAVLEGGKSDT